MTEAKGEINTDDRMEEERSSSSLSPLVPALASWMSDAHHRLRDSDVFQDFPGSLETSIQRGRNHTPPTEQQRVCS